MVDAEVVLGELKETPSAPPPPATVATAAPVALPQLAPRHALCWPFSIPSCLPARLTGLRL